MGVVFYLRAFYHHGFPPGIQFDGNGVHILAGVRRRGIGMAISRVKTRETDVGEFTWVGGRALRAAGREVLFGLRQRVEGRIIGHGGSGMGGARDELA